VHHHCRTSNLSLTALVNNQHGSELLPAEAADMHSKWWHQQVTKNNTHTSTDNIHRQTAVLFTFAM